METKDKEQKFRLAVCLWGWKGERLCGSSYYQQRYAARLDLRVRTNYYVRGVTGPCFVVLRVIATFAAVSYAHRFYTAAGAADFAAWQRAIPLASSHPNLLDNRALLWWRNFQAR